MKKKWRQELILLIGVFVIGWIVLHPPIQRGNPLLRARNSPGPAQPTDRRMDVGMLFEQIGVVLVVTLMAYAAMGALSRPREQDRPTYPEDQPITPA